MKTILFTKKFIFLITILFICINYLYPVDVSLDGDDYIIDNGNIAVRVPAVYNDGDPIPPPVKGIRYNGSWYGNGSWDTDLILANFTATPLSDGVKLYYDFQSNCKVTANPYAEITIRSRDAEDEMFVEETYEMSEKSKYVFELTEGFQPDLVNLHLYQYWAEYSTSSLAGKSTVTVNIEPRERFSKTLEPYRLFYLLPRYTQSGDATFFSVAEDTVNAISLGIGVCRAGKWIWPHDSYIWARTNPEGGKLYYDFPTQRGGRYYLLLAGDETLFENGKTIVNSYLGYSGAPYFYDNYWANPTSGPRQHGRNLYNDVSGGSLPSCNAQKVLNWLHPDFWGYPYNMWSPINPNFYSDLVRYPAMLACGCAEDPLFDSIKNVLEDVLRRHIEMSWIVPGGAGECPGYHIHGYDIIKDIAPLVKQHIDIDVTGMDAYVAAQNFLDEVGRTPQGDTHSPDEWEGNLSATKEYPHYGIVFVGNQEKLYWKAGPMRGHYHGDHLSFHWWDMAIDHQVSYSPLAAQEHMHNRVSFSPGDWDYANMGGFERIIAFNGSSTVAHVGISQVESNMLRKMPEFPPVNNQGQYEERTMDEKLTYRRTMVMVKGDVDYFVIRDQNWGVDLEAKFCIHTVGNKAEWNDSNQVDFGNMSLYFAKPSGLTFERFDYNHPKDSTIGAFFKTSGQNVEFITVMWPNSSIPSCSAIPGGVQVGSNEIIFADPTSNPSDPVVTVNDSVILYTSDVDLNRSQGYGYLDLGRDKWEGTMYIPEVGYPMGPLPNWLLEQRVPGFEPEQEEYVINITGIVSLGFGIDITPSGGNGSYDYIWSNGETTQDLTSLSAGTYTVTVEDENNCYNIASFDVDSTLVRILPQKQNDDNITIYPIPSKNIIYIKGVDNGNVSIISVQGKVLLNKEIEFKNSHLNISGLPKGTYIIRVENEGKVYSKKIMKE